MYAAVKNPWLLFISVALGLFMFGVDTLAIGVAIEPMAKALSINIATLQWFLTAYAIGNSSFLVTAGRLGDHFGRRRIFIYGIWLFIISSAIIAVSSSPIVIIAGRMLQGVSGGTMSTTAITILMAAYPPEERTGWMAGLMGASGLGMVLGPAIGGVLIQYASWRMIFVINIPIGMICIWLAMKYVPTITQRPQGQKLDIWGALFFIATLIFFTTGVSQIHYWTSEKILIIFAITALLLIIFLFIEKRASQPLIEFALFKVRNFMPANAAGIIIYFVIIGWLLIYGIYLQRVSGLTPMMAGIALLPFGFISTLIAPRMQKLSRHFGNKGLITVGFLFAVIAFVGMSLLPIKPPYFAYALLFALFGLSCTLVNSNSIPAALEFTPAEKAGIATGKCMMLRWLGGAIGGAVISTVFIVSATHKMTQLIMQYQPFASAKIANLFYAIIMGQANMTDLSHELGGNQSTLAIQLINTAYHYGLVVSTWVMALLAFLALVYSYVGIREKPESIDVIH